MKDCKGQDCAAVDGEHSVACLYEYALARLSLTDTPEMRVLFWDSKDALVWDEVTDSYVTPPPLNEPTHDSDCSANNRGVPDLLGPCDCQLAIADKSPSVHGFSGYVKGGERDYVIAGSYRIGQFSDEGVWIEDVTTNEAGSFSGESFGTAIKEFFNANF